MRVFRGFLNGINSLVYWHDRELKQFVFGVSKPTGLQKAMKELEKNPTQENEQKVKELLQRNSGGR